MQTRGTAAEQAAWKDKDVTDLAEVFAEAGVSPMTHYELYGAQESEASNIIFVDSVPDAQRVTSDTNRAQFDETVPSNPKAKTPAAAEITPGPARINTPADTTAPELAADGATATDRTITLTFDEALYGTVPDNATYTGFKVQDQNTVLSDSLMVPFGSNMMTFTEGGTTVTLTLPEGYQLGKDVPFTVAYNGTWLTDAAGNAVASTLSTSVTNRTNAATWILDDKAAYDKKAYWISAEDNVTITGAVNFSDLASLPKVDTVTLHKCDENSINLNRSITIKGTDNPDTGGTGLDAPAAATITLNGTTITGGDSTGSGAGGTGLNTSNTSITITLTGTNSITGGDGGEGGNAIFNNAGTVTITGTGAITIHGGKGGGGSADGVGFSNAVTIDATSFAGTLDLEGSDSGDTIDGGSGNDILKGLDGNDTIIGGSGDDTLTGGLGNDTFVFAVGDSDITEDNADTIMDFGTGDTIQFSTADAYENNFKAATTAVDDFDAALAAANTALTGSVIYSFQWAEVNSVTTGYLFWDNDDNAGADEVIILTGVNTLAATDIIDTETPDA